MNSFISLLWQFEIPNLPITTTILKNQQEIAHHYFYSDKQNRVLRKKNPNALALVQQLCKKQGHRILQIHRNNKTMKIQINICQPILAIESLSDVEFEGQFCLVQPLIQFVRVFKLNGKQDSIEIQYLSSQKPIESQKKQLDNFINKICLNLEAGLQKKNEQLKISKHKVKPSIKFIQIILAVNPNIEITNNHKFMIIQGIKLQFQQKIQNVIRIQYEPTKPQIKTSSQQQRKLKFNENSNKKLIENFQYNFKKQLPIENEDKINTSKMKTISSPNIEQRKQQANKECQCCGVSKRQQLYKQICKQDFITLRKSNGQSIRGFNEQYYQVCMDCYMQV